MLRRHPLLLLLLLLLLVVLWAVRVPIRHRLRRVLDEEEGQGLPHQNVHQRVDFGPHGSGGGGGVIVLLRFRFCRRGVCVAVAVLFEAAGARG